MSMGSWNGRTQRSEWMTTTVDELFNYGFPVECIIYNYVNNLCEFVFELRKRFRYNQVEIKWLIMKNISI